MSHFEIFVIDILSEYEMATVLSTFCITAGPFPIAQLAGLCSDVSSQSSHPTNKCLGFLTLDSPQLSTEQTSLLL